MTIIHTTDDLIRLLNENDEFRQAVRRHVLSDELIQLPERLAKFETHVESFIDEQRQFNKEQRQFNKEQRQFNKEQRQFNQRMESSIGELRDTVAQHGKVIGRQGDAIGELRGKVARQVVGVHFLEIADGMGFRWKGILTRWDLGQLIFQRETNDIPQNDRRSFFRADLVIETTDSDVLSTILLSRLRTPPTSAIRAVPSATPPYLPSSLDTQPTPPSPSSATSAKSSP